MAFKMSKNKTTEKFSPITNFNVSRNDEVKFLENETQLTKVEGVSMVWKNLNVTAEIKQQHVFQRTKHNVKKIIKNVNGYAGRSNLVAILGTSGSGKSTLMSVLAKRYPGNLKVDGDILINGKKIKPELMRTISGFVYQDDIIYPSFTISEHLHLTARLKLDRRITVEFRKNLVNQILTEIGLTECANRLIGSSSSGEKNMNLSGGELKRLAVATELLTNPHLLFCDEPTTGLDSFTALKLMTIMRKMTSQRGTTIICSIHQPSKQIFDLFHQIILLRDGKIAFSGPTEEAVTFFQSIGYTYNEEQNPADYLIKNLAMIAGKELKTFDNEMNQRLGESERDSWFSMLCLLTYRDILYVTRNPFERNMRIINKAALGVILGIVMMGTYTPTQEGMQSLKAMMYIMVAENTIPAMQRFINYFPEKMPVFLREYSNDVNSPSIFYLSNIISLIPELLLDPILQITLMYTLLELKRSWFALLATITIIVIIYNAAVAFGILASLATNSISTANTICVSVGIFLSSSGGIYLNLRSIPWVLSWIRYVSWVTYAVESLLLIQLNDVDYIKCSKATNVPCLKNGKEVLESMGFEGNNIKSNVMMMCCIFLILHVLGFFILKIRLYPTTKRF